MGSVVVAALAGVYLTAAVGPSVLWFGGIGAAAAYFYTAPPVYLAARGLGELMVALSFGPLMTVGTVFAITGHADATALWVGVPLGLLTCAILWINEFPDAPSDARVGKRTLVVRLGTANARWGYVALLASAFASIGVGVLSGHLPPHSALSLLSLPIALRAASIVVRSYRERSLARASQATVMLQLAFGALLIVGLFWR
jgi:1,4-dihydroxy-2-naphthoate octaprenyltransferase